MKPAKTKLTTEQVVAKTDEAGLLAKEIKAKTTELEALKLELMAEAETRVTGGEAVTLKGNVFQATIPFSAEFSSLTGAETDVDKIDTAQGLKLAPYGGEKAHKAFTGDQGAVKELRDKLKTTKSGLALFNKIFSHKKSTLERTPSETKFAEMARTATVKHIESGLKAVALKFVNAWKGKSVALDKIKKD